MRIGRVWAYLVVVTLTLGMWATMNSTANAVSAACTTVNGSAQLINANGTISLNAGQQFTFEGGEVISVSANVPAGARVRIFINGQELDFDNSAGAAAQNYNGSVTIPAGGTVTPDSVSIITTGLITGGSVTVNFTCSGATTAQAPAITPANDTTAVDATDNAQAEAETAAAAAAEAAAEAARIASAKLLTRQQTAASVDHSVDGLVQGISSSLNQGGDGFNLLGGSVNGNAAQPGNGQANRRGRRGLLDPANGRDLLGGDPVFVPINPCSKLYAAQISAVASVQSAKTEVDFATAKRALDEANKALRDASCPELEAISMPGRPGVPNLPADQSEPVPVFPDRVSVPVTQEEIRRNSPEFVRLPELQLSFDECAALKKALRDAIAESNNIKSFIDLKAVTAAQAAIDKAQKAIDATDCKVLDFGRPRDRQEALAAQEAAGQLRLGNEQRNLERLEAQKKEIEARIARLEQIANDSSRGATIRDRAALALVLAGGELGTNSGQIGVANARIQQFQNFLAGIGNSNATTSNYTPHSPQTSTKRFDALINHAQERKTRNPSKYVSKFDKSRFQGMSLNPILKGEGFNGKFHFGDRSGPNPWVIFLNTSATFGGDNQHGADRTTTAWNIALGGQVRINPNTLVGLTGGFKRGVVKSKATNTRLEGDYASIGVSLTRKLYDSAMFSLSTSYTNGQNDVDVDGATGSFDVEVYSANASFSNSRQFGLNMLATSLGASYNHVERDAYTDSNGLAIFGSNVESANFSANATLSRIFKDIGNFASITPSVGISGNYNYRESLSAALVNGVIANQQGLGATLSGGLAMKFDNGVSANLGASYGLFQDDVQNWSVTGALVFPLN